MFKMAAKVDGFGLGQLVEVQFVPMQSQSSIYGAVAILGRNSNSILVATSRHSVLQLECKGGTRPVLSTVPFTYLPGKRSVYHSRSIMCSRCKSSVARLHLMLYVTY